MLAAFLALVTLMAAVLVLAIGTRMHYQRRMEKKQRVVMPTIRLSLRRSPRSRISMAPSLAPVPEEELLEEPLETTTICVDDDE